MNSLVQRYRTTPLRRALPSYSLAMAAFLFCEGQTPAAQPEVTTTTGFWAALSIAVAALVILGLSSRWMLLNASSKTPEDLEALRTSDGFLLIIGALIVCMAVPLLTLILVRPQTLQTADVLAIISSVTTVVGTLVAAFFGIQAAGAGRTQALSMVATQGRGNLPPSGLAPDGAANAPAIDAEHKVTL